MSQNEVANLIGVDRSTVTAYELGIRTPTPKVAQKLAKVLKFKWTKFYS